MVTIHKAKKPKKVVQSQVILAEERTVLAYIRTVLSFVGIVFVLAKLYFKDVTLANPTLLILLALSGIILTEEIIRVRSLRKRLHLGF